MICVCARAASTKTNNSGMAAKYTFGRIYNHSYFHGVVEIVLAFNFLAVEHDNTNLNCIYIYI